MSHLIFHQLVFTFIYYGLESLTIRHADAERLRLDNTIPFGRLEIVQKPPAIYTPLDQHGHSISLDFTLPFLSLL